MKRSSFLTGISRQDCTGFCECLAGHDTLSSEPCAFFSMNSSIKLQAQMLLTQHTNAIFGIREASRAEAVEGSSTMPGAQVSF